tara:strand:+ start:3877 stop:4329 length:453 start_codon:yes stop_codon:yes gene_type:complete
MKKQTEEQLFEVFNKIIASEELAARAIKSPSEVFIELGLEINSPVFIDENFYEVIPELRKHFEDAAAGNPHPDALVQCDSPACIACLSATMISAGAAIAAAVAGFPEDTPLIEALAELVGVSEEEIMEILEGTKNIADIVKAICKALGTC